MARRRRIDRDERRRRLAVRHHLIPRRRTDDLVAITDDLVAMHSTDPATVFLGYWVRMKRPSIAAVERALYDDRTLIRHHAMRRTLWVFSRDVLAEAHAAATVKIAASERRRNLKLFEDADEIADPESWLADAIERVVDEVRRAGPINTRDLGRALPELKVPLLAGAWTNNPTSLSAHRRVPLQAAFEARLVRTRPIGDWISSQYAWAEFGSWTGSVPTDLGAADAQCRLARRVLHGFGPLTAEDLQWWTGWTKGDTRRALEAAGAVPVDLDEGEGWVAAGDTRKTRPVAPWAALLPALDPTTMGWEHRDWYLPDDIAPRVFDRWGNAGPTVWLDGEIVGGWGQREGGEIVLDLMREIEPSKRKLIDERIDQLQSVCGGTRVSPRFPSPSFRALKTMP